jgi:hypothetical protein
MLHMLILRYAPQVRGNYATRLTRLHAFAAWNRAADTFTRIPRLTRFSADQREKKRKESPQSLRLIFQDFRYIAGVQEAQTPLRSK